MKNHALELTGDPASPGGPGLAQRQAASPAPSGLKPSGGIAAYPACSRSLPALTVKTTLWLPASPHKHLPSPANSPPERTRIKNSQKRAEVMRAIGLCYMVSKKGS